MIPLADWARLNGVEYIKAKDAAYKGRLSKIVKRRMIKKVQIMIPADHKWL